MRRLDHSMIFVVIAGTYTPFALIALRGALAGALLIAVWAGAAAGVVVTQPPLPGFCVSSPRAEDVAGTIASNTTKATSPARKDRRAKVMVPSTDAQPQSRTEPSSDVNATQPPHR
jgi:Haemolysin-III related